MKRLNLVPLLAAVGCCFVATEMYGQQVAPIVDVEVSGAAWTEPGQPPSSHLVLTNSAARRIAAEVDYLLQRNPSLQDGQQGEASAFPQVGDVVDRGTRRLRVDPRSSARLALASETALSAGAYLLTARIRAADQTQLVSELLFVSPPSIENVEGSRFGINASQIEYAPQHARLGIGWVRFENMKWPFISPAPGVYRYDGSVAPWHVPHDEIARTYREHGLHILPFLFQTPQYASTAPAGSESQRLNYPPQDASAFAEFVFQTVARYGSQKHPPEVLKTEDGESGLGLINVFEIWNEPNLDNADWGAWVGSMPQYYELYRPAAEAVKRADPGARVTNGGFAGVELNVIDTLRSFQYADGKSPLDFTDVLNAHFYTGRVPPEEATLNPNIDRSENREERAVGARSLEDHLAALDEWRDRYKPQMPIWISETGYDTAGPYGIGERMQAARLPRAVMLALGNGAEKVMVYRESGSTPSQHAASGLMRNDGSLKPAWFAYATLVRELRGTDGGMRLPYPDPQVRLFAWPRGEETIYSAWTVTGTAALRLHLGQATVTDTFGHRATIAADELTLSEFPIYIRDSADTTDLDALTRQARRAEAARREELVRQEALQAYLFDFGSTSAVGIAQIGSVRTFTPVVASETYDEARGYGFTPRAALRDDDAPWKHDPLERDSVRVSQDVHFQLRATPGRYRLRAGLAPLDDSSHRLQITGATLLGGNGQVTHFSKQDPHIEAELTVEESPLILATDSYADLRWLSLVEVAPDE